MHFLIRAACLLAAGAAGWALARRKNKQEEATPEDPQVVYLSEEDAVIDAPPSEQEPMAAVVDKCFRRMDPITLTGSTEAIFMLADGEKVKLHIAGEGGFHLAEGDAGLLTWSGDRLILFEKENGELIGGMYYVPAGEENAHE